MLVIHLVSVLGLPQYSSQFQLSVATNLDTAADYTNTIIYYTSLVMIKSHKL